MEHMSSPVRFRCNKRAAPFSEKELSSLSIEDQKDSQFPFAMRDLPPVSHPGEQLRREAEETNGRHPHLSWSLPSPGPCTPPGSPPVPPRPSRGGKHADSYPSPLRRQLASQVSLDSPLSPASRPRSPWGRCDPYDSPEDQDKEYVGFATYLRQVNRKMVKKGIRFTLMVVGESGLGKSTLINSLFLSDLYRDRKVPSAQERINQTVDIVTRNVRLEEKGIRLHLTVVDTPGFGDAIDNRDCWKPIVDYVDQQFEQFFRDESSSNRRRNIQDNRVHCCLYFIPNTGHGLRPLDVQCMKALHQKVNIIPVLAKADTMTAKERCMKKQKIQQEIRELDISIYKFPDCDSDEDDDYKKQDQLLKKGVPFAVIGGSVQVESEGRRFRGRAYPWGVADVEDPSYSDSLLLRNMLMRTHTQDLIDVTQEIHYENFRAQCIESMRLNSLTY